MKDSDLLYQSRQALSQGTDKLPPEIQNALAQARHKAVARASERPASLWHFSAAVGAPARRWAVGASFASLAVLAMGLTFVHQNSVNDRINRIAEIDRQMISDRLPVQAYLDPGFLAFQENARTDLASAGENAGLRERASEAIREFWSLDSLFPGTSDSMGPGWGRLTVSQREALAPLEAYWPDLDYVRKRKWIKIADRFDLMSEEQQALAKARMEEWVALPTADRRMARQSFSGVVEIPEDVRVMKWSEYQKLSEEDRARFVEESRAKALTLSRDSSSALAARAAKPLAH